MLDQAWHHGDGRTNYRLKDGDRVMLLFPTSNDQGLVEAGVHGTVVHARTPKVARKRGTSPYFANVDLDNGIRIRVPHGALKKEAHHATIRVR